MGTSLAGGVMMKLYMAIFFVLLSFFSLAVTTEASWQLGLDWRVNESIEPSACKLNWWFWPGWGIRSVYAWEEEDLGLSIVYIPREKGSINPYVALGVRDVLGLSQVPVKEKIEFAAGLEFRMGKRLKGVSTAVESRLIPSDLVGKETSKLTPFFGFSINYDLTRRPRLGVQKDDDLYLLAKLIRAEAEGEPYEGQVAVGAVVINRVKSRQFPNTIREVIYQENQFSCVPKLATIEPLEQSLQAARDALKGKDPSRGALYYYNPKLASPAGLRFFATADLQRTVRIGNHIFFR